VGSCIRGYASFGVLGQKEMEGVIKVMKQIASFRKYIIQFDIKNRTKTEQRWSLMTGASLTHGKWSWPLYKTALKILAKCRVVHTDKIFRLIRVDEIHTVVKE